jgi:hypothetical protein
MNLRVEPQMHIITCGPYNDNRFPNSFLAYLIFLKSLSLSVLIIHDVR